jgi:hypothetical protein
MRFANATTMSLVRLGLFLTACAISANSAQAGRSATTSLPSPDSIEADHRAFHPGRLFHPGSLAVLPEDGREIYFEAFDAARREIRIEICVLEDPLVLQSLKQAIEPGSARSGHRGSPQIRGPAFRAGQSRRVPDRRGRSVASQQSDIPAKLPQGHPHR